MIRIIGLSATLPNYIDVASFLRVNPQIGLFFFDDRFRPVPLKPTFIGVKATNTMQQLKDMDEICYRKASRFVKDGHQVTLNLVRNIEIENVCDIVLNFIFSFLIR